MPWCLALDRNAVDVEILRVHPQDRLPFPFNHILKVANSIAIIDINRKGFTERLVTQKANNVFAGEVGQPLEVGHVATTNSIQIGVP